MPWLLVVQLMFIDDDATQETLNVEQQNTKIAAVRYKYVTERVDADVLSNAEWW